MINSISIIFPLYNEEKRLFICFKDIINFNQITPKINKEYIFVSDGSTDNSVKKIKEFIKKNKNKKNNTNYKVIATVKNHGKGHALKKGILKAKKKWILTADVDISVSLNQIISWNEKKFIKNNRNEIYFGSRNIIGSSVKLKKYRKFIGHIFIFFLKFFLEINLTDTQCGFKLYNKNIAKKIFKGLSEFGFIHDVEIVLLSKKKNFLIRELPVKWIHKKNSKINLFYDSCKMLVSIIKLKKKYKSLIG